MYYIGITSVRGSVKARKKCGCTLDEPSGSADVHGFVQFLRVLREAGLPVCTLLRTV